MKGSSGTYDLPSYFVVGFSCSLEIFLRDSLVTKSGALQKALLIYLIMTVTAVILLLYLGFM